MLVRLPVSQAENRPVPELEAVVARLVRQSNRVQRTVALILNALLDGINELAQRGLMRQLLTQRSVCDLSMHHGAVQPNPAPTFAVWDLGFSFLLQVSPRLDHREWSD